MSESIFRAKTIWKCSSEMNNQLEFHIYHDYNKVRLLRIYCVDKKYFGVDRKCFVWTKIHYADRNTRNILCGQKIGKCHQSNKRLILLQLHLGRPFNFKKHGMDKNTVCGQKILHVDRKSKCGLKIHCVDRKWEFS